LKGANSEKKYFFLDDVQPILGGQGRGRGLNVDDRNGLGLGRGQGIAAIRGGIQGFATFFKS